VKCPKDCDTRIPVLDCRMIFLNPSFDPCFKTEQPTREPMSFHMRLAGYKPTPLRPVAAFACQLGLSKVFVKNESHRLGLPAFKILGASWATYTMLSERYPDVVSHWYSTGECAERLRTYNPPALFAATDGNHGRAVAHSAKLFGLRSYIYVPKGTAIARVAAIESEGANVAIVDGTYDDAVARAANEAQIAGGLLIQDNSWEEYQIIPRYVVEGYSTMMWEIDDALASAGENPTHVVVQIGNGSFAEAVVRHYRAKNERICIIGVEPTSAACALESVRAGKILRLSGPFDSVMVGMNCDSPSLISFPILQKGIDAFVALTDGRSIEAMRTCASEGIISGETGAAGLGALWELLLADNVDYAADLNLDVQSRVLVFVTEGATNPESYGQVVSLKS
jgi:diaminopropionate ammonia-lyase